ncbi:MAG: type II toxin-antitoxin system VapC family toxin [Planctomycetota bacterium]|jgi:predicted nucleic acid-binding protein
MSRILLDTGPLVAFLNRRDTFHDWVSEFLTTVSPPLLTCEAVVTEACFILRRLEGGPRAALDLVARGIVRPTFRLEQEIEAVSSLVKRYADVPMSLADACLVRMTELERASKVLTLDRDFRIYRRNRRRVIPVIMPPA